MYKCKIQDCNHPVSSTTDLNSIMLMAAHTLYAHGQFDTRRYLISAIGLEKAQKVFSIMLKSHDLIDETVDEVLQ